MTLAADTAHPRHKNWRALAAEALAGTGVHASRPVHANLTAPALVAEAVRRDEGRLSVDGALVVATGVHTGRSAQDKFVVDEPSVSGEVWWGKVNNRLAPEKFAVLKARVQAYLQGQELFTQDLYAGADPAHRVRVRMVSHRRLAGAVRPQHLHPPDARGTRRLSSPTTSSCTRRISRPTRRSTACAAAPPSRCRSSSASSSSPAPSTPAR